MITLNCFVWLAWGPSSPNNKAFAHMYNLIGQFGEWIRPATSYSGGGIDVQALI